MNDYRTVEDLPRTIPLFPLGGALLLPRGRLPLHIFEPRYLTMVDDALAHHRLIGMVQPRKPDDPATKPDVYDVGCVGRLTVFNESPDGRYMITLSGVCRFRVEHELDTVTQYRQMAVDYTPFADDLDHVREDRTIDRERIMEVLKAYLGSMDISADWDSFAAAPPETLINSLAAMCPFDPGEKQALLEAATVGNRADVLVALMEIAAAKANPDEDMPVQ